MKVTETSLPGVLVIEPKVFEDERGFFLESYQEKHYREAGIPKPFVQDNHSCSVRGTLRGLHYQLARPQGKLVRVVVGEVFDVAVDIRRGSPSFGQWFGTYLSAQNKKQMYIPEGFAHGFCVTSEVAEFLYKCTDVYVPGDQYGIIWNDSDLKIDWPVTAPLLSPKDQALTKLTQAGESLPGYLAEAGTIS
jgi:dTDP-4-dehydrorhamnose 3,5-epimerase